MLWSTSALLLLLVGFMNVSLGSVDIPLKDVFQILFLGGHPNDNWTYIVIEYRLPKALTAILVGTSLAISGLLMQTLFKNPLAGPYVLGISSGASLGVAILILGASAVGGVLLEMSQASWLISLAAAGGSFLVMLAVLAVTKYIRNTMSVLIVGLMFSSLASALIAILSYFSSAESLQRFLFWGFGSLGDLSWQDVLLFSVCVLLLFVLSLSLMKSLNSMLLGEQYAKSLGVDLVRFKNTVLVVTSVLTGLVTAFSGPIAFVGLSAPHLTRLLLGSSDHRLILPMSAVIGSLLLLISDMIAQLPGSDLVLPINAITTLFGAPIVVWLLMRKRKLVI